MEDWEKIKDKQARLVVDNLKLSTIAVELLEKNDVSELYIYTLIEHKLWLDVLAYFAYVLPLREGVWWACLATRDFLNDPLKSDQDLLAIETAKHWVYRPNEQNRSHAMKLSRTFKQPSQAQVILLAIGLGGAEKITSTVEIACSSLIAGAITISALQGGKEDCDDRFNHYLAQGINIAQGGNGKIERNE